jgi:SAM-dependent methyltransferase
LEGTNDRSRGKGLDPGRSLKEELLHTLPIYGIPSQSFWRALELRKLRELKQRLDFDPPVLEIGCGTGAFGGLLFDMIDDGIDNNPRAIEQCGRKYTFYRRLHCMDVHSMDFLPSTYMTVLANCVIEHIPNIEGVLREVYRVLQRDGKFVATVPMQEMNNHLLFRSRWYVQMRRRQLQHVNLLTQEEWSGALSRAGFGVVEFYPYLNAKDCLLWDMLDFPGCIGFGHYRLSAVLILATRVLGRRLRERVYRGVANWLTRRASMANEIGTCAVAAVAKKIN